MPDYTAHVLVCTNSEGAENKRHCGDKGGDALRQKFNKMLAAHGLMNKVAINDVGCTSQHSACETSQAIAVVYGLDPALGGVWYVASPDDVEEIVTEHLVNGRVVERLRHKERAVKLV